MVIGGFKSRGDRRKVLQVVFFFLVTLVLLIVGAMTLFKNLGSMLIYSEDRQARSGRVALILMGDTVSRAEFAAELWEKKEIETFLFFECQKSTMEQRGWIKSDATLTKLILIENGVPETAILQVDPKNPSTSTITEAKNLLTWLEQEGVGFKKDEITIVTSWYHTSRSAWIFKKVFEGNEVSFRMAAAPTENAGPGNWWANESVFLLVIQEYLKWLYYLTNYAQIPTDRPGSYSQLNSEVLSLTDV